MGTKTREQLEGSDAEVAAWMQGLDREQLLQLAANLLRRRTRWTLRWQEADRELVVLRERIVRLEKLLLRSGAYEKPAKDLFGL